MKMDLGSWERTTKAETRLGARKRTLGSLVLKIPKMRKRFYGRTVVLQNLANSWDSLRRGWKKRLNFLIKIRKRWEKIHSKELLEKSKFEKELKRLECSVNYEGGNKQKGPS